MRSQHSTNHALTHPYPNGNIIQSLSTDQHNDKPWTEASSTKCRDGYPLSNFTWTKWHYAMGQ